MDSNRSLELILTVKWNWPKFGTDPCPNLERSITLFWNRPKVHWQSTRKNSRKVKIHPEGKFIVDIDPKIKIDDIKPNIRVALKSDSYVLHKILPNKVKSGLFLSVSQIEWIPSRVVKSSQKSIALFAKLRTPFETQIVLFAKLRSSQFRKLRKLRKLRVAICYFCANCEYFIWKYSMKWEWIWSD